jgi:FlaA1/EpsC-like NDP-sugar epimerase
VLNNVAGTFCVAECCGRFGVERMALVSTDKAAEPCSVMGATKWVCEEILRAMAPRWTKTSFVAVRFGNVLGSRGSAVSVFREQIERGGPVTITHPEMTRYFMTIPEAVRLVLQAGAVGRSGELYLLDMGEPIRILDLARDMICLCGLEPGKDIPIEYTGIRPGERLHERLVSEDERIEATQWDGLSIVQRPAYYAPNDLFDSVQSLIRATDHGSADEVRGLLSELVPGSRGFGAVDAEVTRAHV